MKEEAKLKGVKRIAVCICGPLVLVDVCHQAAIEFSDSDVQFDFHEEVLS